MRVEPHTDTLTIAPAITTRLQNTRVGPSEVKRLVRFDVVVVVCWKLEHILAACKPTHCMSLSKFLPVMSDLMARASADRWRRRDKGSTREAREIKQAADLIAQI